MLHRITWVAVPVIGLVVVGSGLGFWGYNQSQERTSLARQVENQYNASLHQLADHTLNMESELGQSLISNDKESFQRHLRQIWRLSYGAETDAGRLPTQLMPLHGIHSFLSSVTDDTANWMDSGSDGKSASVHKRLESYYIQSKKISNNLSHLQSHVLSVNATWLTALHKSADRKNTAEDNPLIDGLKLVDSQTATYVESLSSIVRPVESPSNTLKDEPIITRDGAKQVVQNYFRHDNFTIDSVDDPRKNSRIPVFVVNGSSPNGPFHVVVTQHGGHVVSFDIDHKAGYPTFNFSDAEDHAMLWLISHGFKHVDRIASAQYGGMGYFVFAPVIGQADVLNQNLVIHVGLDSGRILSFDGHSYLEHPVKRVAVRNFSNEVLRAKFGSHFQILEQKNALVLDSVGVYQPVVVFYGTSGRETYRIMVNAHNGKEMSIERLSRHDVI